MSGLAVKTIAEAVNQAARPALHIPRRCWRQSRSPVEILSAACPAAAQLPHRSRADRHGDRPGGRTIKGINLSAPTTKIDIEDGASSPRSLSHDRRRRRGSPADHRGADTAGIK